MQIFWFIPTHSDGRYLGTSIGGRSTDLTYLQQIAQAVDRLGYRGALLPTGRSTFINDLLKLNSKLAIEMAKHVP